MSLVRIAARIAAVQALKGRTLCGNNVLDSQLRALDVQADGTLRTDQEKRFISVYCDAASARESNHQRAFVVNGQVEFLFEAGITAAMVITDPETDESVIYEGIPATDSALEFHLDMVMRQIGDALTDAGNVWADIFRGFCSAFVSVERARASGDEKGVRLAAHQMKVTVTMIADPVRGMLLNEDHPLKRFFSRTGEITVSNPAYDPGDPESPATIPDPVVAAQVELMQAQIAADERDWHGQVRRYGMMVEEARVLLNVPVAPGEATEPDIASVSFDKVP